MYVKRSFFLVFDSMQYTAYLTPSSYPIGTNKSPNEGRGSCGSATVRHVCSSATDRAEMVESAAAKRGASL